MNNYFNQEVKEPTQEQKDSYDALVKAEVNNTLSELPRLVRSSNRGDKIYYVQDGVKHWITSPEVLRALGYDFGQEKEIDKTLMAALVSGNPIRMDNVNEFILPVNEAPVEDSPLEESIEIQAQEVDNAPIEGYISIIIPCVLSVENVEPLLKKVDNLRKYFSGEIITVVVNKIDYKNYSPKFGNKVIECEDINEGVERARRVARGEAIVCDSL